MVVRRYFLLVSLLIAPAMVSAAGLVQNVIPNRLREHLRPENIVQNEQVNQYALLDLLAQEDDYCDNFFIPRFTQFYDHNQRDFSLWCRFQNAKTKEIINDMRAPHPAVLGAGPRYDNYDLFYHLYPCDLSLLARKYRTASTQELHTALASFDAEIRNCIIRKYNIKTDWFYWAPRAVVCAALAGVGAYLGWKYFKK